MRSIRHLLALLVPLSAALPTRAAPAQPLRPQPTIVTLADVAPGDRVRIGDDARQPLSRVFGRFVGVRAESVIVRADGKDSSATSSLALARIFAMEVARGRHVSGARVVGGLLLGAALGTAVGLAVGSKRHDSDCGACAEYVGGVAGFGLGGIAGLVWGMSPRDRWVSVALPRTGGS